MTADKIYAELQLRYKLECHFIAIDANSERTSKFQKKLQSCISDYRDIQSSSETTVFAKTDHRLHGN